MNLNRALGLYLLILLLGSPISTDALHPLRLSLCEVDYTPDEKNLTVDLKLFLTDVNEALTLDPNSTELAFCQPNEPPIANQLLLQYLNQFFYVMVNGQKIDLSIKSKALSGEGENTALGIFFEHKQQDSIKSLEIKNAVFTDLFFDQNNIVYVHVNGKTKSLMLNKKTSTHRLSF